MKRAAIISPTIIGAIVPSLVVLVDRRQDCSFKDNREESMGKKGHSVGAIDPSHTTNPNMADARKGGSGRAAIIK
jgi:hypothetical protein